MYKDKKKNLKSYLSGSIYNDELFSRDSMSTILRALLEPVANQNATSLIFTRLKNKDGLEGLIKRLEYCTNVEIVDVLEPSLVIKDDYIELEFVIFTSARYNFVLIWDYSIDTDKNYTKGFFLANSSGVNEVFEILQSNMSVNYKEKFYAHKPERRENELLNEALFNVFKKLNNSIQENSYKDDEALLIDLDEENNTEIKIKEISHEIKNQLSIIDIQTKILEKTSGQNKNIDILKKAVSLISYQLNELKSYDSPEIKEIVLQDIIYEAAEMFTDVLAQNNNKITYEDKDKYDIKVFANDAKLLSVFGNIIKNANEAVQNDTIEITSRAEGSVVCIDITNHGKPINSEEKNKIFEKNYTTKQKGSGFGLFGSKNYIEELKGSLKLAASDEKKTTFRILLPLN